MNAGFIGGSGGHEQNPPHALPKRETIDEGIDIMRKSSVLATLALAAGIAGTTVLAAPVLAQGAAPAAPAARAVLGIPEIHQRLTAAGYTDIDEIDRERDRYEVKATDREGRRVELDVDAATAEVLRTEVKRSKRSGDDRATSSQRSR